MIECSIACSADGFADTTVITAAEGTAAAVCAAQFAAATGRRLRILPYSIDQMAGELAACDSPQMIAALCDEADDALLFGLLDQFQASLGTDRPLFDLPQFTIVTARDAASLSRLFGRLAAAARRMPAERIALRHYAPTPTHTNVIEVELGGRELRIHRESLTASPLLASYASTAAVVAFSTHGSEACAKGGDGTVLCGLHLQSLGNSTAASGLLGCGYGHPCPRGPHPMPLHQLGAEVMMLGSCNGLRLADSITQPQFNFALAFVDGPGLAFVSTLFTSIGGDLASVAFLAAMSGGCTLGEATALTNALLHHAALERTAYVAVGDVTHRAGHRRRATPISVATLPAVVDTGEVHFAEVRIRDQGQVDAARRGRLTLSIAPDGNEGVPFGFHRVERDFEGTYIASFFFCFPEPLRTLRIAAVDRLVISEQARTTLDSLGHWIDLWNVSGLADEEAEAFHDLRAASDEARRLLAHGVARSSIDGGFIEDVQRHTTVAKEIVNAAAAGLLQHLTPKLGGAFWLSNLYTTDHFERSNNAPCPSCSHGALSRTLRHAMTGAARTVVICPRCGIAADLPEASDITSVSLAMPTLMQTGEELEVEVLVTLARPTVLSVYPRLSTYDESVPPPTPESRTCARTETSSKRFSFVFRIPEGLLPHRYYVKVLLATESGLAFASRPFFVVPGRRNDSSG